MFVKVKNYLNDLPFTLNEGQMVYNICTVAIVAVVVVKVAEIANQSNY